MKYWIQGICEKVGSKIASGSVQSNSSRISGTSEGKRLCIVSGEQKLPSLFGCIILNVLKTSSGIQVDNRICELLKLKKYISLPRPCPRKVLDCTYHQNRVNQKRGEIWDPENPESDTRKISQADSKGDPKATAGLARSQFRPGQASSSGRNFSKKFKMTEHLSLNMLRGILYKQG